MVARDVVEVGGEVLGEDERVGVGVGVGVVWCVGVGAGVVWPVGLEVAVGAGVDVGVSDSVGDSAGVAGEDEAAGGTSTLPSDPWVATATPTAMAATTSPARRAT